MAMRCNGGNRGFTFVEVLLVITVVATLGGVGLVTAVNTQKAAREQKLTADVNALNSAVQLYQASVGPITATNAQDVLTALKVRVDTSDVAHDTSMGLRGSFVDPRLYQQAGTNATSQSGQLLATWNPATTSFVLTRAAGAGIASFALDNHAAATAPTTTTNRTSILKAVSVNATNAHWVWDYSDGTVSTNAAGNTGGIVARAPVNPSSRSKLPQPTFSPVGGTTYALTNFPMQVTPTLASTGSDVGQIYYSINSGPSIQFPGGSVAINAGDTIYAYAKSLDIERWLDSDPNSANYDAAQTQLDLTLSAPTSITYQYAGGAMLGGSTVTATSAVATLSTSVPAALQSNSNFVIVYNYGTTNPLTNSGAAQGTYSSATIGLLPSAFGTASSVTVTAAVKAVNTAKFLSSPTKTATVNIQPMALGLTLALTSGGTSTTISKTDTITISRTLPFPAQSTVYYTLDGSDPVPGNSVTSVYSAPFAINTTGLITVKARAYPDPTYTQWFTSPVASATYTVSGASGALPVGAIVNAATIQESAQFKGNLVLSSTRDATNVVLQGSSSVVGNMYVPGTPPIYKDHIASSQYDNQLWSTATDSNFANYIIGRQFNDLGVETVPATETPYPRVKDTGGGSLNPTNYTILIQDSAKVQGKVIRQYQRGQLASVGAPTAKTNSNSRQYDSWTLSPSNPGRITSLVQNPAQYASASLVDAAADITFLAGNYGSVTASVNGATIILGDAAHPDVVQNYSFETLGVSGGANIQVVGKVNVTFTSTISIHDNAVVGNANHPDWLQLNFYTTQAATQYYAPQAITVTGGSSLYAQVVAPNGTVTFENNSVFMGSVSAYKLELKSTGVLFTLPPVTTGS